MKKILILCIWIGLAISAILGVLSIISNLVVMYTAFPESLGDKNAYMFILGRWTFTLIMLLLYLFFRRLLCKIKGS